MLFVKIIRTAELAMIKVKSGLGYRDTNLDFTLETVDKFKIVICLCTNKDISKYFF